MCRSKGLAESTEVYCREPFFSQIFFWIWNPSRPEAYFYRWSRARLLHSSQLGLAVIIDLLRVENQGTGTQYQYQRTATRLKNRQNINEKKKKKKEKEKKKPSPNRRTKQIPHSH
ncbi:hypothetical protein VN97_g2505 [Penicillium thymicola]|uniref:Uncharacterized protein n=1 Tax=Penicillium thymicola TaxID=293382 RepID=A0AAI9TNW7_PENTH|nr:hypothetical protein VN97_g2505 [Penicillium thymicola]